jgi:hypothetical protein
VTTGVKDTVGNTLSGQYETTSGFTTGHVIGDSHGGGILAYILQSGESIQDISDDGTTYTTISYDANVLHGLIAATEDQNADIVISGYGSGDGRSWSNIQSTAIDTTDTALGTGATNTIAIINQSGHSSSAAKICVDYSPTVDGTNYSDWYLPSKDELHKLYEKKTEIGGFSNINTSPYSRYWSSSEGTGATAQSNAWWQDFYQDQGYEYDKSIWWYRTRPVRAF